MLTALPLLICYAQTISIARQVAKLETLMDRNISKTAHYQIALSTLRSINPATFDKYYALPMLSFAFVTLFCWLMTTAAYFRPSYFSQPNVILGGLVVVTAKDSVAIHAYQAGTFVAGCFGFVGAYIYVLWKLLDRINNNDIYPISFYYFASRILAACLIAGVIRHVMPDAVGAGPILLLAFASGFVPDVFVTGLIRRASVAIQVLTDQSDPKRDVMPSNSSLLMIQGLDRDKIDRLVELNVTNSEVLACQNPFILWLRLPYELLLVTNWISQAQLYRIVKEDRLLALRAICICGILDFATVAADQKAREAIAPVIGVTPDVIEAYIAALNQDVAYIRLREVNLALAKPWGA
jgi:hypothetical protein